MVLDGCGLSAYHWQVFVGLNFLSVSTSVGLVEVQAAVAERRQCRVAPTQLSYV